MGSENLRPDLVVQKGNDIIIFDVTVPFENGFQAFEDDRKNKVEKYRNLATEPQKNMCKIISQANEENYYIRNNCLLEGHT